MPNVGLCANAAGDLASPRKAGSLVVATMRLSNQTFLEQPSDPLQPQSNVQLTNHKTDHAFVVRDQVYATPRRRSEVAETRKTVATYLGMEVGCSSRDGLLLLGASR